MTSKKCSELGKLDGKYKFDKLATMQKIKPCFIIISAMKYKKKVKKFLTILTYKQCIQTVLDKKIIIV